MGCPSGAQELGCALGSGTASRDGALREILLETVTQHRAGEREAVNQGDNWPQYIFLSCPNFLPPNSPFFPCIGEKVLPPPSNPSQTGNSSVHMNQKDFPNLGAEGRKPAALLLGFCTSTCILQTPLCAPLTIKYELVRGASVISPFAKANPRGGHGPALSWLQWGISGGFCFLLLCVCVCSQGFGPVCRQPICAAIWLSPRRATVTCTKRESPRASPSASACPWLGRTLPSPSGARFKTSRDDGRGEVSEKPWVLPPEPASGYGGPEMPLFLLARPITSQWALVAFKSKTQMALGLSLLLSLCLLAELRPHLLLRELVLSCSRKRKVNKIWFSPGRVMDVSISSLMHHV